MPARYAARFYAKDTILYIIYQILRVVKAWHKGNVDLFGGASLKNIFRQEVLRLGRRRGCHSGKPGPSETSASG